MIGTFLDVTHRRLLALLLGVGALALAGSAGTSEAALVDQGTFMTDTASGLDWLQLDQTVGLSYNDVVSQMGVGGQFQGWAYADVFDIQQLWINAGGSLPMSGWSGANNGVVSQLLNVWGRTRPFDEARVIHETFFGSNLAVAIASDDPGQANSLTQDFMSLNETTISPSGTSPIIASALIRATIPEPSCALLALSLVPCLVAHRPARR